MITARGAPPRPAPWRAAPALVAAVGAAALVRAAIGGAAEASSVPGAVAFCALLLLVAAPTREALAAPTRAAIAVGVVAAMALVGLSLVGLPAVTVAPRAALATLAWWAPLVAAVAAAEELVLRGVLFDAVDRAGGAVLAVAVSSALFAVIHLPLYGMAALPLDLCVGVLLGCLRVATRSVWGPLVTHVLADVATGWIG